MFSRQEHQTDDQVICWNCEEAVHQSAIVCPYCNVDIQRHQVVKASGREKITPLPKTAFTAAHESCQTIHSSESVAQMLRFAATLFFFLSGSALFVLAIVIALFARDGAFTISWTEQSWLAFFGLGLSLLSGGMFFMSSLSERPEEHTHSG